MSIFDNANSEGPGFVGIRFCQEWYVLLEIIYTYIKLLLYFAVITCCIPKKIKKTKCCYTPVEIAITNRRLIRIASM